MKHIASILLMIAATTGVAPAKVDLVPCSRLRSETLSGLHSLATLFALTSATPEGVVIRAIAIDSSWSTTGTDLLGCPERLICRKPPINRDLQALCSPWGHQFLTVPNPWSGVGAASAA